MKVAVSIEYVFYLQPQPALPGEPGQLHHYLQVGCPQHQLTDIVIHNYLLQGMLMVLADCWVIQQLNTVFCRVIRRPSSGKRYQKYVMTADD